MLHSPSGDKGISCKQLQEKQMDKKKRKLKPRSHSKEYEKETMCSQHTLDDKILIGAFTHTS